jgi:aryl-alcohol dehydrogenase-like predicted oxidoreductase
VISRRTVVKGLGATGIMALSPAQAENQVMPHRPIPSSGETIPVIGLGTSRTFNVEADAEQLAPLLEVVETFFDHGGRLIDSSPMYGRAEAVTGELLARTQHTDGVFAATKVWADGDIVGMAQMDRSINLMGVQAMDLMQIHNLRDWRVHIKTLREWKESGKIRYIGITTSRASQYEDFAQVMRNEPLDFVQFNYSMGEPEAESVLLPLAADKGVATLINRPYMRGVLFSRVKDKPLPEWAAELDVTSWGQFFLKFVLSHPAVTCIIPATSKAHHMRDNMAGGLGVIPDQKLRQRMLDYVSA